MPISGLCYHQLTEFIHIWYTLTDTVYYQYLVILEQAKDVQKFETRFIHFGVTVAKPAIPCPSIHIFIASDSTLLRSVLLHNLTSVSVPGWVPCFSDEPVAADPQIVPSLLSMLEQSQCQTTLTVIEMTETVLTEEIVGITRLALALDKWIFSWKRWSPSYHDPLDQLIKGLAEKTITGISGETAFTLPLVLTSLHIRVDCKEGEIKPTLCFMGETLVNAMEAWLGTRFEVVVRWEGKPKYHGWHGPPYHRPSWIFPNFSSDIQNRLSICQDAGLQCSIGLSGFELLGNCVYILYEGESESTTGLETLVRVVDDSDDDDSDGY